MQDLNAVIYPTGYVRERIKERFGVTTTAWYYHLPRTKAVPVELAGYEWYDQKTFDALVDYFAVLPSTRRRLAKAISSK